MHTPGKEPPGKTPLLDTAFWISVIVVALLITFSMLIMGICAVDLHDSAMARLALTCIIAGPAIPLLMIITGVVFRTMSGGRGGESRKRGARVFAGIVYMLGAPCLVAGTYLAACHFIDAPMYQEANNELANTIPVY